MARTDKPARKGYAEEVSEKIIAMLEAGTAPWQKPWKPGIASLPFNAKTGKPYRGMNVLWLEMQGYVDPRWMTYRQAQDAGAQVRKGERGTSIRYWKFREERVLKDRDGKPILDEHGKKQTVAVELSRPRAFFANVFNADQIDGLPPMEARADSPEPERHARAEHILERSGANIRHVPGNRAFYSLQTDSITLPGRDQFESSDSYYATALHELGHWTGHESRLNRDLSGPFGGTRYAREELRAEIASLMLGDQLGIGHDPSRHASYVGSWIEGLRQDHNEIFRAAADAEKITAFVLAFEQERDVQQEATNRKDEEETPEMVQHRVWLDVPFEAKDMARAKGAKWDWKSKQWYAPADVDLAAAGLGEWLPQPKSDPLEAFSEALADMGLRPEGEIVADGRMHRVPVESDRHGAKSGAYALHLNDMFPGGYIQNFKTGEKLNWKHNGAHERLTAAQKRQLAAEIEARRAERRAMERAQHEETARAAEAMWAAARPALSSHPYALAKHIAVTAENGLRVVPDKVDAETASKGVLVGKTPLEVQTLRDDHKGAQVFLAGDLLVPLRDADGRLWSLQSINPGFKGFMHGGRKAGLYSVAGSDPEKFAGILDRDTKMPLVLAEGYATADTVARLLGQPVVVAFDAGNLDAVAGQLTRKWPGRPLLIAADNDHARAGEIMPNGKPRPNVGLEKATEAARRHGGAVLTPPFQKGATGSDWNDYAASKGDKAAGRALQREMAGVRQAIERKADREATPVARRRSMRRSLPEARGMEL